MSEVNRVPFGLLSMLDMKARGSTPRFLAESVSAVIDLRELYMLDRQEMVFGQAGPVTTTGGWPDASAPVATQVPQNEVWYVWEVGTFPTSALNGATGQIRWKIALRHEGSSSQYIPLACDGNFNAGNGDRPCVSITRPIWMAHGDELAIIVEEFAAWTVAPDIMIRALITRMRI